MIKARNKREIVSNILQLFLVEPHERRKSLYRNFNPGYRILGEIHAAKPATAKFTDKLILIDTPYRCAPIWTHRHIVVYRNWVAD